MSNRPQLCLCLPPPTPLWIRRPSLSTPASSSVKTARNEAARSSKDSQFSLSTDSAFQMHLRAKLESPKSILASHVDTHRAGRTGLAWCSPSSCSGEGGTWPSCVSAPNCCVLGATSFTLLSSLLFKMVPKCVLKSLLVFKSKKAVMCLAQKSRVR